MGVGRIRKGLFTRIRGWGFTRTVVGTLGVQERMATAGGGLDWVGGQISGSHSGPCSSKDLPPCGRAEHSEWLSDLPRGRREVLPSSPNPNPNPNAGGGLYASRQVGAPQRPLCLWPPVQVVLCAPLPRPGSSSLGSPVISSLAFSSTALASPVYASPWRLVRGRCTHVGGAWPLHLPHGQEQGQAQSRCSVHTGERTNGLSVKGATWQASRQARQPQDAHLPSPLSYNSPEQARFLGLQAFAHAVSSAGQLLPFRIEHRWALTGNMELRGALRGAISLPCIVSARQVPFSSCRRDPGPVCPGLAHSCCMTGKQIPSGTWLWPSPHWEAWTLGRGG